MLFSGYLEGFVLILDPFIFQISLDPPVKQGQTCYHFLIILFSKDEELSLALNMSKWVHWTLSLSAKVISFTDLIYLSSL